MSTVFQDGHALIVGVGADLPVTVKDAEGIAGILSDAERCAYRQQQVRLLTDEQAARAQVLAALDTLSLETSVESTVVIYFSGHGYKIELPAGSGNHVYYLMTHGYDLQQLGETAISGAEFTARLGKIPAKKLLLLLDCCHAGGFGLPKSAALPGVKAPVPPETVSLFKQGGGRVVIASSGENEYSLTGTPYSAFTVALVEALCGKGATKHDGYVRVWDLMHYTTEIVPKRTGDQQHPVPDFHQLDNFVLAYYAAGDVKTKGLPFKGEPQVEPHPGAWPGGEPTAAPTSRPDEAVPSVGGPILIGTKVRGDQIVGTYQTINKTATPPAESAGRRRSRRRAETER